MVVKSQNCVDVLNTLNLLHTFCILALLPQIPVGMNQVLFYLVFDCLACYS